MYVVNCTTAANFFHALRRQMHQKFRKPLIVIGPKTLLKDRAAYSPLSDMGPGTTFRPVLPDTVPVSKEV
jgi:2-oxoglutarate dehydrogenase E1 component